MSNLLSKIEPHASRLEDAADKMDAAGIGGHPKRGHAAVLRDMAASLRADAARGKTSDVFDGGVMYGAASTASSDDIAAGLEQLGVIRAGEQNSRRFQVMKAEAVASLNRHNIALDDDDTITLVSLNRQLAGKGLDVSTRMRLKSMCGNAGILVD